MKHLLWGLLALAFLAVPAEAQDLSKGCRYYAAGAIPSLVDTQWSPVLCDSSGRVVTSAGTPGASTSTKAEDSVHVSGDVGIPAWGVISDGTTSFAASGDYAPIGLDLAGNTRVVGPVANLAANSGNPVKGAGAYNTTPPAPSNGQIVDLQSGPGGELIDSWRSGTSSALADGVTNTPVVPQFTGPAGTAVTSGRWVNYPYKFNGATWDRDFTCASTAVVNITAGNTTQIIGLSGSTVIRVCSFILSSATAATTAAFQYGTGSNCATGTTTITGNINLGATNLSMSVGNGSLFRTAAGNALCVNAVTGNVVAFVSYAQF